MAGAELKIIDTATAAALEAGHYGVRALVLFDLPSGRWGAFDDQYDLAWGGDTYVGAAGRFTLAIPPGASDMSIRGLTATFSGLDSAALAWVQSEDYRQRPMSAALAIIATETPQVVAVKRWFTGFVDQVVWQERPDGHARLIVKCESASRELDRSGARTRSDADQRALDPNDGFFKHTVGAIATEIGWGTNIPQPAAPRRRWWQIF
jgi:hypothetical protein